MDPRLKKQILYILIIWRYLKYYNKQPCRTSILQGATYTTEILDSPNHTACYENFRMDKWVFNRLACIMRDMCLLKDTRVVSVEEQLGMFLYTVGHNQCNRALQDRFQHSGETIGRYFHHVLDAMYNFARRIIKPGDLTCTPPQILSDRRYYPWFKDWRTESQKGFKQSNLASQCTHRYKIYIEGSAWSVSEKYILACDSPTLIVKPLYYDFFTRGLMPVHHYWPIKDTDKCRSIKFAVNWGNSHKQKSQAIGKTASSFIQEELKMDFVYDYMFHLLTEYAKLLRYKPTKPRKAIEVCPESMACRAKGIQSEFMRESMVKTPSDGPCTLPPPFSPPALQYFLKRKANVIKQVEIWEQKAWSSQSKQQ